MVVQEGENRSLVFPQRPSSPSTPGGDALGVCCKLAQHEDQDDVVAAERMLSNLRPSA